MRRALNRYRMCSTSIPICTTLGNSLRLVVADAWTLWHRAKEQFLHKNKYLRLSVCAIAA
jgi:hypothetical protein